MYQLNFQKKEKYDSSETGITIEARLKLGNIETVCFAKIDTGSEICIFRREIGEFLEIDIEGGFKTNLITLSGGLADYGHGLVTRNARFEI